MRVNEVSVTDNDLYRLFHDKKAVHISDLHITSVGYRERKLIRILNEMEPDILFITGDFLKNVNHAGPCLEVLSQIKNEYPKMDCVIVSAMDDVESAVKSMNLGASDYLVKPLNSEKLIVVVNRTLKKHNLQHELALFGGQKVFSDLRNPHAFAEMVTEDEAMALVFHQIEAVAHTDYSVVINGESGTGKEMLARVIHRLSNRANAPLCGQHGIFQ